MTCVRWIGERQPQHRKPVVATAAPSTLSVGAAPSSTGPGRRGRVQGKKRPPGPSGATEHKGVCCSQPEGSNGARWVTVEPPPHHAHTSAVLPGLKRLLRQQFVWTASYLTQSLTFQRLRAAAAGTSWDSAGTLEPEPRLTQEEFSHELHLKSKTARLLGG